MKIAVAGAFGFIGQHLISHILESTDFEIVAITRSEKDSNHPKVHCLAADLYSRKETAEALEGCDVAIYLVHSMAPNARLAQGHFRDYDFILADNFGRAAKACGVKHIIYVGGLIPEKEHLSPHLSSRLEVEEVLRSYGTPVTTFRCGIVIGPKASSFSIIARLTERLPVMVLPQWMRTLTSPIYVKDLVSAIIASIHDIPKEHRIIDACMEETVSYKDIVLETAKVLEKSPTLIDVPYVSPHLSKLWVRLVSGASKALVYPLIDSVRHQMLGSAARSFPKAWGIRPVGLKESIALTFNDTFEFEIPKNSKPIKPSKDVRSVQRLPLPKGKNAAWVAREYLGWMPFYLKPFLKVVNSGDSCEYQTRLSSTKLLELKKDEGISKEDRHLYWVTGGLLAKNHSRGRFEFRESHNKTFVIVALQDFRPALPWTVYRYTQAVVHRGVMKSFVRHLSGRKYL